MTGRKGGKRAKAKTAIGTKEWKLDGGGKKRTEEGKYLERGMTAGEERERETERAGR